MVNASALWRHELNHLHRNALHCNALHWIRLLCPRRTGSDAPDRPVRDRTLPDGTHRHRGRPHPGGCLIAYAGEVAADVGLLDAFGAGDLDAVAAGSVRRARLTVPAADTPGMFGRRNPPARYRR